MTQKDTSPSTGLAGLDKALTGLRPGDNVVWQVDRIENFLPFVEPFCRGALESGRKLVYFRFAKHDPLVAPAQGVEIHELQPSAGFEKCVMEIHRVIKAVGDGGYFMFDMLSDLTIDWCSDQMLGNFFMLVCPYISAHKSIGYFPILRDYHSVYATSPITETAQVVLDIISDAGKLYLHPEKVTQRYSPTIFMLHAWEGDDFVPVTQSAIISEVFKSAPWQGLESSSYRLGVWNRQFIQAREVLKAVRRGEASPEKADAVFKKLLRMAISRHERILKLAEKQLTLSDVLDISRRMIGTGLIGGKSVGMLLARAILEQSDTRWSTVLEPHDSFFIGSDVFYTFLVRNDIWWIRRRQRDPARFLEDAAVARERFLAGTFPDHIQRQFQDMLDYFGQSPIIVRSSSLLEDSFGNAFAGKYDSVFCVNQGSRAKRLDDFLAAVRNIYASTMSDKALTYRAQRGMLDRDEQMALLVQRVSGGVYGDLFYPQVAGVGLSYNPYVWSKDIDPAAGVMRLVFGLGTRAVDRHDDDYTRVVALNAPDRRPEANFDEARQYTQKRVDLLDLKKNKLLSRTFDEVVSASENLPLDMFATRDDELARRAAQAGLDDVPTDALTFKKLLSETSLVDEMRQMLHALQTTYEYPVDIEFTANFIGESECKINLLQCRPFQFRNGGAAPKDPGQIPSEDLILQARGAVIGQGREAAIDRFIYVSPSVYSELPDSEKHAVARLIGKITHLHSSDKQMRVMLLGPGRWGTTTPSLGVPINFADIHNVSVLCEIVTMREGLVPDVSLGTHLFSEMVEMDILYLALFPSQEGNELKEEFFLNAPNRLAELLPDQAKWADAVHVIDASQIDGGRAVKLNANTLEQRVVCYLERESG